MADTSTRRRSREWVENELITAAADLLGEVGPRALSVRMIAERAGVNHGLVHHYFGGKAELLRAAMARLVDEHHDFAKEQSGGRVFPAPLALTGDPRYLRAVVRAVLDGDDELATTELSTGNSVPRAALDYLATKRHVAEPDIETKAKVAMEMALEMGWAALEPFILAVVDVRGDDVALIRDLVRKRRIHLSAAAS